MARLHPSSDRGISGVRPAAGGELARFQGMTGKYSRSAIRPAGGLAPFVVSLAPIGFPAISRTDAVDGGRPDKLGGGQIIEHHQRPAAVAGLLNGVAQQTPVGAD